jgi:hypothetical protein
LPRDFVTKIAQVFSARPQILFPNSRIAVLDVGDLQHWELWGEISEVPIRQMLTPSVQKVQLNLGNS